MWKLMMSMPYLSASAWGMSQEESVRMAILFIVVLISIRSHADGRGRAVRENPIDAALRRRPPPRCWTNSGCGRLPAWAYGCTSPDGRPAELPAGPRPPCRIPGTPRPGRPRRCSGGELWWKNSSKAPRCAQRNHRGPDNKNGKAACRERWENIEQYEK